MEILIEGRPVGPEHSPFIVAELSGNHNQSLARAKQLIDLAVAAGVDAIKLQTYTADTMTLDCDFGEFAVTDPNNLWHGYTLHKLYDEAHTPWEWHAELFEYIRSKNCIPFSSPFDAAAVDFLEELDCPAYKIASFELTDLPLIQKVASVGKPVIISTGMGSQQEVLDAVECCRKAGNKQIVLLKCTSTYPADPKNTNLNTMDALREMSNCMVGLSDHTIGIGVAVASVALGAVVIEKHLTIDRQDGGVDSSFSMEPDEFKQLVFEARQAKQAMGSVVFGGTQDEQKSKQYRRSIYVKKTVQAGDVFSEDNLAIVRPGFGLSPKHWDEVVGKVSTRALEKGHPLTLEDVDSSQ